MTTQSLELGPLELQVLGLLNTHKASSVLDIQKNLKKDGNELAYTTVMTVLSRLYKKGHLKRVKEGRQYLYQVQTGKENVTQSIFDRVRNSLFGSDRLKPILALLDSDKDLTAQELKELKKIVDDKLKAAKERP